MYYFPQDPPYFVLIAGLLVGIACGAAFDATLRQTVKAWSTNRKNIQLSTSDCPFWGFAWELFSFSRLVWRSLDFRLG
jgi:hypothetical protein